MPLAAYYVDTDVIAPQSELLVVDADGLADAAFRTWRYNPDGTRTAHVLNDARYASATILLTGDAFGCGSSREHAVWALKGCGFKAVVATSFGDIFERNAARNRIAPVIVARPDLNALIRLVQDDPACVITLDFVDAAVRAGELRCGLSLSSESRRFIVEEYDEILDTLRIVQGKRIVGSVAAAARTDALDASGGR